jgi:hypothetical protein
MEPSNGYLDTWLILWHFSAIDGGSKIAVCNGEHAIKAWRSGYLKFLLFVEIYLTFSFF